MNSKYESLATKEDLVKIEMKINKTFLGVESDIFMWMFIFWIGQITATFGFIFSTGRDLQSRPLSYGFSIHLYYI